MQHTINLRPPIAGANVFTDHTIRQLPTVGHGYLSDVVRDVVQETGLVREHGGGYQLPPAAEYTRRIVLEAEHWMAFVADRSSLQIETITRKALQGVAATLRFRAHSLLIPSKLAGVSRSQPLLWDLLRRRIGFGTRLDIEEVDGRLAVSYEGERLGWVQVKHRWAPALVPFGLEVRVACVTGHERSGYTLGLNVLLTNAGNAVAALLHALGQDPGGGRCGGEEAAPTVPAAGAIAAPVLAHHAGDGAGTPVELDGEQGSDEVRFWRDERGTLRMNVPHVVKHSPSGPEISYRGSGPADAALSVLSAVTSREEAERFYQLYKDEVIAHLDARGDSISRDGVKRWLSAQRTERP